MNNLIGISGHMQAGKDEVGKIIQYLTTDHCKNKTRTYLESKDKISSDGFGYSDFYRYSSPYEIKKFADKLKDIVCLLINCTREELEDRTFKERRLGPEWSKLGFAYDLWGRELKDASITQHMTPRLLLQLLGTECGRQIIHPNIWTNALFADYIPNLGGYSDRMSKEDYKTLFPKWIITDVRFPNEVETIKNNSGIVIRVERPCPICHQIFYHKMDCGNGSTHESEVALDDYKDFDYTIINDGTIEDLVEKVKNIFKNELIKK